MQWRLTWMQLDHKRNKYIGNQLPFQKHHSIASFSSRSSASLFLYRLWQIKYNSPDLDVHDDAKESITSQRYNTRSRFDLLDGAGSAATKTVDCIVNGKPCCIYSTTTPKMKKMMTTMKNKTASTSRLFPSIPPAVTTALAA